MLTQKDTGELIATARCLLIVHQRMTQRMRNNPTDEYLQGMSDMQDMLADELLRLARNNSQLHSSQLGDSILVATMVMTAAGCAMFDVDLL